MSKSILLRMLVRVLKSPLLDQGMLVRVLKSLLDQGMLVRVLVSFSGMLIRVLKSPFHD